MPPVEDLWERLVRAALHRDRIGTGAYGRHGGIAANVPSSLTNNRDIDSILRAADEIQDEDATISRILCEHAYSLAQNLDPNSEGRGVLQFKTGLMSVIKQKLAKRDGGGIDRSQDIARLREFYKLYREKNRVDKMQEEEMLLRESGTFSGNLGELERKTVKRKRVFATLKVLGTVLEQLSNEVSPEDADRLIPAELKRMIESDAAMTEDIVAYNIIPLDAPTVTNVITSFAEVQAAISAVKYFRGLPKLPDNFPIPASRNADIFDFLHHVFGFQKDNVSNQREHVVLLLANAQSRLGIPEVPEPKLDEAAAQEVFLKSLDNYINWCNYLSISLVWSKLPEVSTERKLLFLSLYYLIWGEAANIRFLPECLCYIFHHMGMELNEILRQQVAQPAKSCASEAGVSFLNQVICPLYDVVAAEAGNNDNGRAPHSAWRNYDDFNEYFWSITCFQELSWPWRKDSPFLIKPTKRSKNFLKSVKSKRQGKTSFVEHRTFLHLYHSFHRLWIFLFMMFQVVPKDIAEALSREEWKKAVYEEIRALEKNTTWTIVKKPKNKHVVGCKWVFTVKHRADGTVERYKARLVAKGFTQQYGVDYNETFAPVAKLNTVRILLSIAVNLDWPLQQLDIKNAFLNGHLEEEVYMKIPPGFENIYGRDVVCRLRKTIYGLKQSPYEWFKKFNQVVKKYGYKQAQTDHTMFFKHSQEGKITILIVYVDDIILTGNDLEEQEKLKLFLSQEFEVKDLGPMKYFLGMEVARTRKGIVVSQRKYVLDLLKETGMSGCRPKG